MVHDVWYDGEREEACHILMDPTKVKGRLHAVMSLFVPDLLAPCYPNSYSFLDGELREKIAIIPMLLAKVIKCGGGCPCAACL